MSCENRKQGLIDGAIIVVCQQGVRWCISRLGNTFFVCQSVTFPIIVPLLTTNTQSWSQLHKLKRNISSMIGYPRY